MASIRKTKKRLKRELRARKALHNIIDDSLHGQAVKFQSEWLIATTEFELAALKSCRSFCAFKKRMERKLRKEGRWKDYCEFKKRVIPQSYFIKELDPTMHDVMAHREAIPFKELGVKTVSEHREEIKQKKQ